jgi:hypothetical protein
LFVPPRALHCCPSRSGDHHPPPRRRPPASSSHRGVLTRTCRRSRRTWLRYPRPGSSRREPARSAQSSRRSLASSTHPARTLEEAADEEMLGLGAASIASRCDVKPLRRPRRSAARRAPAAAEAHDHSSGSTRLHARHAMGRTVRARRWRTGRGIPSASASRGTSRIREGRWRRLARGG